VLPVAGSKEKSANGVSGYNQRKRERYMHKARLIIKNLTIGMALWATAGTALAITLTPFTSTFQNPIGIDWYEPTGQLIMSVNYPSGTPNNLDQ
jgi:hypothetical protein